MADIFFMLMSLGNYLGVFISWFFLIAFLFNLVSSINSLDKTRVILSLLMAISYFSTNLIDMTRATHLDYMMFDIITVFAILIFNYFYPYKSSTAFYYLIVGLSINASLYFFMHYDIVITENRTYWWFWSFHVFWVYFNDIVMALVLVLNKDFFKLVWLLEKLNVLWVKCNSQEKRID
jgi:hypothetical protein